MKRHVPILSAFFEILRMLTEKDIDFPEVLSDYECYHALELAGGGLSSNRAKLVAEWIDVGSAVLDVGIGDGNVARYLIESKKCEVVGIDVSKRTAEKVRRELGLKVIVRNVNEGLDLKESEIYDFIVFMEILEHLPQIRN